MHKRITKGNKVVELPILQGVRRCCHKRDGQAGAELLTGGGRGQKVKTDWTERQTPRIAETSSLPPTTRDSQAPR